MKFVRLIFVVIALSTPLVLQAEQQSTSGISVSQTLDRTEMPFESTAVLEVSLSWPGSADKYLFDRPPQLVLERLKVAKISSTVSTNVVTGGEVTTKMVTFTLKPTSAGLGKIDPATFGFLNLADSVAETVSTQALTISVAEPLRVAKRKVAVVTSRTRLTIVAVIVLALITGLYLFIRFRNRKPRLVVKAPVELFIEELGALRQTAGGDLKRFQTGLYKLLVAFLTNQYQINPAGLSTKEMLDLFDHTSMTELQKEKIAGWLWRAEREKFSPLAHAPGETIRLEAEIREFFQSDLILPR